MQTPGSGMRAGSAALALAAALLALFLLQRPPPVPSQPAETPARSIRPEASLAAPAAPLRPGPSRPEALPPEAPRAPGEASASRRGRVRVTGQVLDATGGPISGATLGADTLGELASSGADGRFVLWLEPGPGALRVTAAGYAESRRRVWAPSEEVFVRLAPAGALKGRVVAAGSGSPVAGVAVRAVNSDGLRASSSVALSTADGSFALEGLPPGEYVLSAANARWHGAEQIVRVGVAETQPSLRVEVSPASSLTVQVLVAGEPCQQGIVNLSGPVSASAALSANGPASFDGLLPGPYQAELRCPPGAPSSEPLQVGLEPLQQTWELTRGASVHGVVETTAGERLAGVPVVVAPSASTPANSGARCLTNSAGEFECNGLLAGEHECWTQPYSSSSVVSSVTLAAGKSAWVKLNAVGVGSIRARWPGAARDGISVSLVARREGAPAELAQLDAGGFLLSELELGQYDLFFEPTRAPVAHVALRHHGEIVELLLPEPERASISGSVRDEHGMPVIDAWVRARPAQAEAALPALLAPVLSDDQGEFTLNDLLHGPHDLEVEAAGARATLRAVEAGARGVVVSLPAAELSALHGAASSRSAED